MRRISMPRHQLSLLVVLCLAVVAQAQTINPVETARQLASTANDSATRLEDRRDALQKLQQSAQLFLGAGEKLEAARVLNRAGRLHLTLYSPEDSIIAHKQALSLLKDAPPDQVEV